MTDSEQIKVSKNNIGFFIFFSIGF